VGSNVRRVGNRGFVVGVTGKELQHSVKDLQLVPARELGVNRLPGAEALGKISPGDARLGDVKHRIHEDAVGHLRRPRSAPSLCWQQGFDPRPFIVGQLVATHLQT
jgi:hypothetical protein